MGIMAKYFGCFYIYFLWSLLYLCVYIVKSDHLCVYIVMRD